MKEIFKRLQNDTPLFFKRLRNIGLYLSATGTTLVAIPHIPEKISSASTTAIWLGMVIAAISQLTVQDPTKLQQ